MQNLITRYSVASSKKTPHSKNRVAQYFFMEKVAPTSLLIFSTISSRIRIEQYQKKHAPVAKIPTELDGLYNKWNEHASSLMSRGNFIKENYDNNFRDFEDPLLHHYAIQLNNLAKEHSSILLDIIRYSKNNILRQKAADLLSWGDLKNNIHCLIHWDLLRDPDPIVRNNIARAFLHSIHTEDECLLKQLIDAYCYQAMLPTHGDRNKALFSLKEIVEAHPNLSTAFSPACKSNLIYMSEASILENIKQPAKDILSILNKSSS